MHVVATSGHVDHGKSTLVEALTGTDPDRLSEEKSRGLTIDLGFASTRLDSGLEVGFVDVPGHVRFIKNMLAGVGAVDACMFVVAATEGWKPQSEEHLRILELLGVTHGVIALTKVGGLAEDWLSLARMEVAEAVAGTFLAGAEVVEVDAPGRRGLEELRAALGRLLAQTPTSPDRGRPRLWVDRSFPAKGAGTVVTGTLTGGALSVGAEVLVVGPGGRGSSARQGPVGDARARAVRARGAGVRGARGARVRGLQSHGHKLDRAEPGCRLALNLAGVGHDEVTRGDAVILAGQWAPTRVFDASLSALAALSHDIARRGAYQAYLGSGEYAATVRILGGDAVGPGQTGLGRLRIPVALPLLPGDRYVLRESGRSETVGGGEVLDVAPVLPPSRARPDRSVDRVISERGWVEVGLLERLTGERRPPDLAGRWCVAPAARERATAETLAAVRAAGPLGLDVAVLDEGRRALAQTLPDLVVEGGRVLVAGAQRSADRLAEHPFLAVLEALQFTPPAPAGVDRADLREMARLGLVVECEGAWFAASALARAAEVLAGLLAEHPEGVTAAQARDALGTTRRWLIPLLGHLDATGVTRRRGDLRVPGPRLPVVQPGALPTHPGPH